MNYLSFVALAITLASTAQAHKTCIPSGCDKTTACSTLSRGGLANLHLLGCSEIDISPTISILKRDHPESLCNGQFGDLPTFGCGAVGQLQDRADDREVLCESFSKANLVNLAVLGCSKTKINPTINILKRNEICSSLAESGIDASAIGCSGPVKSVSSDKKKDKCLSLSKAGLVNLSLLNCSEIDLSGEYDILKKRDYCECEATLHKGDKPSSKHHSSKPTSTWSTKKHSATGGSGSGSNGGSGSNNGGSGNGNGDDECEDDSSSSAPPASTPTNNGGSGSGGNGGSGSGGNGGSDDGSDDGECEEESSTSTADSSTTTHKKDHTKHHHHSSTAPSSTKTKHHSSAETESSSTKTKHHSSSSDDKSSSTKTKTSTKTEVPSSSTTKTSTKTASSSSSTSTGATPSGGNDGQCESDPEAICKSLSEAGLVNLDLLNCFKLDVSPTIKIGEGLLPAVTSIVGGIIGILD